MAKTTNNKKVVQSPTAENNATISYSTVTIIQFLLYCAKKCCVHVCARVHTQICSFSNHKYIHYSNLVF